MYKGTRIKNDKIEYEKIDSNRMKHYELTNVQKTLETIHGNKYTEYRKEWEDASNFRKIPSRPLYVILETNSYCNMKCTMCARNYYSKEKRVNIEDNIIDKIVKESKELGIPSILVGASTECLINPNIKNILRKIKESGAIDLFLLTNGYCLDDEISNLLIDLQWERLYVSFDAATQETYRKIRGADLEVVENNVEKFLKLREKRNSVLPLVRASYCIQEENRGGEENTFFEKWKKKVDIIDFQCLTDYHDLNSLENLPNYDYQCVNPFRHLNIDCLGNICPCGSAFGWKMIIGNIKNMTIEEAWHSEIMNELRNNMLQKKLSKICRNCVKNTQLF